MGIFTQRPSAYAPPLDGSKAGLTLVGGRSGNTVDPPVNERQLAEELGATTLPLRADGTWGIQLREYPVTGHRSHAVLVLVDPSGETAAELNGLSNSRNFGKRPDGSDKFYSPRSVVTPDGSKLIEHSFEGETNLGAKANTKRTLAIAGGSYDDIVRGYWQRGIQAAERINRLNFDYKGHDPAYEFGGSGGEIQNSNAAAYTVSRAMGLDVDQVLRNAGVERRFPGWGRDLLDPRYKRYVAPPTFPNSWTP